MNSITSVIPIPRNLVVVCIEDHPKAIVMLRTAQKRALEKGGKWKAVFIETPTHMRQAEDGPHERMLRLLTLATQMGGETAHIEAESLEKGLLSLLEKEASRLSLVIIGNIEAERRRLMLKGAPWIKLVKLASHYGKVEVVPLSGHQYHRSIVDILHLGSVRVRDVAYALLSVGVAFFAASALEWLLPPALFRINNQNVALLFMIACAFTAGRFGLLPGLVASVASFFAVNYYFTVPYHMLKLGSVTDLLNMALFFSAALLISLFTSQTRDYAQKAARRELSTQALFALYRIAADAFSRQQAMEKLQSKLQRMLDVDVAFFLPPLMMPDRIELAYPKTFVMHDVDTQALDVAWAEMKTTGVASPFNPGTAWRFEPMISPSGQVGVIGVRPRANTRMDAWFGRMLTAIADQTATMLEHIELERSMEETRISEEREKLRSMLLSSVSHDFKTPLAGIIGALSVHRSLGDRLPENKRTELIESAIEEAQRLDSFITNILDMTRLESGNIRFNQEWHSVETMVRDVTRRLQHRCRQHQVVVHPVPNIEVFMDIMMTEQVLQNVMDNACKYTPANTRIEILCLTDATKGFICEIRDHGAGLPPEKIDNVFDKYARLHKKDSQVAGTGLGLAIGKAVMEAQGGWISATNHPQGGAVFTFCLPKWRKVKPMKVEVNV